MAATAAAAAAAARVGSRYGGVRRTTLAWN